jgi:hypothetical protein
LKDKIAGESAGGGNRDLLPEHRSYCEFFGVDVSRYPQTRARLDKVTDDRIAAKAIEYSHRIRVKIKESATTRHCSSEVAQVVELKLGVHKVLINRSFAVRQRDNS